MLRRIWIPSLSTIGAAVLVSSCAADASTSDDESAPRPSETAEVVAESTAEDAAPAQAVDSDAPYLGGQRIIASQEGVEFIEISPEEDEGVEVHHLLCDDAEALAEKAEHNDGAQPLGWPQEWDGSGTMPDPLCHPDYLEIREWENLDAHSACWEGTETSTLARGGQSREEIAEFLWQQSQARADWEPNPPGGTCAEQWAEHNGDDPEDYADSGNADDR
ncbi:hypothetical protein [Nesterenkonia lutea]|uniref:Secreted protein n=1 Tax=Nesterenkonia lutea TaxID=272919 RepID=A0ABR9JDV0_9MICC|nr:hypothetical protein [Nesterenkonia lutea]MBE1524110.1 hypothetical protein [Nesterenkonia lutea]